MTLALVLVATVLYLAACLVAALALPERAEAMIEQDENES